MKKDQGNSAGADELRGQAETRLQAGKSPEAPARSAQDNQRLLHELQVHQIELEMQNEELRRSRAEVEAGLERYTDLYDFAPVGYLSLDRDGNIRQANLTGANLLGVERARLMDMRLGLLVAEAGRTVFNAFLQKVFAGQAKQSCEVALLRDQDPPLHVRIEATLATEGQECRLVVVDITERKRAEQFQQLSHEILGILNESLTLPDAIDRILAAVKRETAFDAVGIRLRKGDDFPYFTQDGFSNDFLLAENALIARDKAGDLCRDANGNICLECTCGLVISGQTDPANPLFTKGGSLWTNDASPLLDLPADQDPRLHPRNRCIHDGYRSIVLVPIRANREIVGLLQLNDRRKNRLTLDMVHFLEGISASIGVALIRKQAGDALREAHHRLSETLENITDAFFSLDRNFVVTAVNPMAERVLGKSRSELLGKNLWEQFPEAVGSRFQCEYARSLADGTAAHFEEWYPPFAVWFEVNAYPSSIGLAVYFRDITERKRAAAELQQAKDAADAANRAKDDFLAKLSHELRTPLAPVLAAVGMLEQDQRLPEDVRDDLAMIGRNVTVETRLIDDLLDVTRITHGKVHLNRRPVDLSPVLSQAAEICDAELAAKGLRLTLDPPERPCTVMGDAGRLQQVFWNLIRNAIKFTPAGGNIAVRTRVVAGDGADGSTGEAVVVEIRDTGMGIEPGSLSRLFDPFEQGCQQIHRQYGGLGLGLAICKSLVEAHGGSITAASEGKDKGATFTVRLALAEAPAQVESTLPLPPVRETPAADGPLRILLVEDHADTARILSRLLRTEGYAVETVADIASALDRVNRSGFDLLISDLGLPDGSGMDLMRQLVASNQPIKAIALSGYGMDDNIRRSREAGFAEHLVKPVNFPQLQAAIERVVGP